MRLAVAAALWSLLVGFIIVSLAFPLPYYVNIDRAKDNFHLSTSELNQLYDLKNIGFFEGKLPPAVLRFGDCGSGYIGVTMRSFDDMRTPSICISSVYNRTVSQTSITLVHEMAHVSMWVKYGRLEDPHGILWQAEMKRLAVAGAMNDGW